MTGFRKYLLQKEYLLALVYTETDRNRTPYRRDGGNK